MPLFNLDANNNIFFEDGFDEVPVYVPLIGVLALSMICMKCCGCLGFEYSD